jgi:hypothetical protein
VIRPEPTHVSRTSFVALLRIPCAVSVLMCLAELPNL